MRHPARIAALALAGALACKEERLPSAREVAQPRAGAVAGFTMRDLALATALDAKLARLSLAAADLEAALAGAGPRSSEQERALALAAELEGARREVQQATASIANPLDRALAAQAAALAASYAERLVAAARTGSPPAAAELVADREALGAAIGAYRQSRARWRLDEPEPRGAERELAEARRELERVEAALVARMGVPDREQDQDRDGRTLRATAQAAVDRARAAAARLPPAQRDAAARHADAQERVLAAASALAEAPDRERPRAARAYHAAKADALAALADYFAALAAR